MTTLNFEIGGAIISNKFYVIPALRHSINWNNNTLSLIKDSVRINVIKVSPGVQKQTSLPTNTIKSVRVRLLKVTSSETFLLEPIDSNKRYF
jgi:hypothetical protein